MGSPISTEVFLQRAMARFGSKYDYSDIVYKSYKTPIKIRCRTHPVKQILITPEKHLQTTGGCKYCLREMRIVSLERELCRDAFDLMPSQHPGLNGPDEGPNGTAETMAIHPQLSAAVAPHP